MNHHCPPTIGSNAGALIASQVARYIKNSDKAWQKANIIIERENNLLNHRITTTITLQGILFAGTYILMSNSTHLVFNLVSCIILGIVGIATLLPSYFGMKSNVKQITICSTWFYSMIENPANVKIPFPPLIGEHKYSADTFGEYVNNPGKKKYVTCFIHYFPLLLLLPWLAVITISISSLHYLYIIYGLYDMCYLLINVF